MNKSYVYINEEAIKNCKITIPSDCFAAWKEVTDYNNHMSDLRFKKKELVLIRDSYIITDILIIIAFAYTDHVLILRPVISILLFLIYSAYIIIFPLRRRFNIIPNTAASLIFIVLDFRFLIMTLFNFVVCLLYQHIDKPLRGEDGYPDFLDISVQTENEIKK